MDRGVVGVGCCGLRASWIELYWDGALVGSVRMASATGFDVVMRLLLGFHTGIRVVLVAAHC
jgi:hypothetical protein